MRGALRSGWLVLLLLSIVEGALASGWAPRIETLFSGGGEQRRSLQGIDDGWVAQTRVRLSLPDGTLYTQGASGYFGRMREAKDGYDPQDLPAETGKALTVQFAHPEWKKDAGDYRSDFRHYRPGMKETGRWDFRVVPAWLLRMADRPFTLGVEGIYRLEKGQAGPESLYRLGPLEERLLKRLRLRDLDEGRVYTLEALEEHPFRMRGKKARNFQWFFATETKAKAASPTQKTTATPPAPAPIDEGGEEAEEDEDTEPAPLLPDPGFIPDPPPGSRQGFGLPPSF